MASFRLRMDRQAIDRLMQGREVAYDLERRAGRVERAAKRLCPVDTGRLQGSINHALFIDPDGLVARVGSDVHYAPYVELGTSRMAAQPYLRPALEAARR